MVQFESFKIFKDQERVKWGNKWVKTHGPWGKEKRWYHEFGIWDKPL